MYNNEIHAGKFREVPFNFVELGRSGGRKNVFHTFPNSDVTVVEDLGKAPTELHIRMIVTGYSNANAYSEIKIGTTTVGSSYGSYIDTAKGNNYSVRRDALLKALETKGPGILMHPTYGKMDVQLKGNYKITETLMDFGRTEVSVTFLVLHNYSATVGKEINAKVCQDAMNAAILANKRLLGPDVVSTVLIARDKIKKLRATFSAAMKGLRAAVSDITEAITDNIVVDTIELGKDIFSYGQEIVTFPVNTVQFIGSAAHNFAMFIPNTLQNVELFLTDPLSRFNFFAGLFDYGDKSYRERTVTEIAAITPEFSVTTSGFKSNPDVLYWNIKPSTSRVEILKDNQYILRRYFQSAATLYAAKAVIEMDFKTEEELEEKVRKINKQFDTVLLFAEGKNALSLNSVGKEVHSATVDTAFIDTTLYATVAEAKAMFNAYISNKRLNTYKIVTIHTNLDTITTLAYKYFESMDDAALIATLNDIENPSLLQGDYKLSTI